MPRTILERLATLLLVLSCAAPAQASDRKFEAAFTNESDAAIRVEILGRPDRSPEGRIVAPDRTRTIDLKLHCRENLTWQFRIYADADDMLLAAGWFTTKTSGPWAYSCNAPADAFSFGQCLDEISDDRFEVVCRAPKDASGRGRVIIRQSAGRSNETKAKAKATRRGH